MIFTERLWKLTAVFTAASFTGWLYEVILGFIIFGEYADRGLLHLPLCPVYGIGALIIWLICRKLENPVLIFAAGGLISTAAELIASYITENAFGIRLWDYSYWPLSFEWRISLPAAVIFGLFSVYLMKCIIPAAEALEKKFSRKTRTVASLLIIVIISADLCRILLSEI